ncbi:MAG: hypothetical protein KTR31_09675 [Myxococcales bacterium]|nr:hypothetical protein [Myxococcales bacterium]
MVWWLCSGGAWAGTWQVDHALSLQDAIDASEPGDVIRIAIPEVRGSFVVSHALTIEAVKGQTVTAFVEAGPYSSPLNGFVYASADEGASPFTVTLRNLTVDAGGQFRALKVDHGTLRLEQVEIREGRLTDAWGGCMLVQHGGRLEVVDSTVVDCETSYSGGAVAVAASSSLQVWRSQFTSNLGGSGGAVACFGDCEVFDSTLSFNQALVAGGAIRCDGRCDLQGNLFSGNRAETTGGAAYLKSSGILSGNRFCDNRAEEQGGAVGVTSEMERIERNVFWGNRATTRGGGVWLNRSAVLANNTFVGNRASAGGALHASSSSDVLVANSIVVDHEVGNHAFSRGGNSVLTLDRLLGWDSGGNVDVPLSGPNVLLEAPPITGDPRFVTEPLTDCESDDLHLRFRSPAIGAGNEEIDDDLGAFPCDDEIPGNGVDDDCDGTELCYVDVDGDGFAGTLTVEGSVGCLAPGEFSVARDCDDGDDAVFPGATEVCDGQDGDCNGMVDDIEGTVSLWPDLDGDGFGAGESVQGPCSLKGYSLVDGDCAPDDADAFPGAPEACDGLDTDCDGAELASCDGSRQSELADADAGCSCGRSGPTPLAAWGLVVLGLLRRQGAST